jgi:hypothetical protein
MNEQALLPERLRTILNTEAKTIDYAESQIAESNLLAGKAILDQTLKKLESLALASSDPAVQS